MWCNCHYKCESKHFCGVAGFALIRICRIVSLDQLLRTVGGESNPGALWVSAMESSAPGGSFVWTSFAARIGAGSVLSQCLAICASEIVGDRLPFLWQTAAHLGKSFTLAGEEFHPAAPRQSWVSLLLPQQNSSLLLPVNTCGVWKDNYQLLLHEMSVKSCCF